MEEVEHDLKVAYFSRLQVARDVRRLTIGNGRIDPDIFVDNVKDAVGVDVVDDQTGYGKVVSLVN